MHSIGALIRAQRRAIDLTQKELGQRTVIQQSVISRIESGRREPTLSQLRAIASALGVPAALFFQDAA